MVVDIAGGYLRIRASWMCRCQHDECFTARGDEAHGRSCECPKDTGWVEMSVCDRSGQVEPSQTGMMRPQVALDALGQITQAVEHAVAQVRRG
jgi:hypothetical protein